MANEKTASKTKAAPNLLVGKAGKKPVKTNSQSPPQKRKPKSNNIEKNCSFCGKPSEYAKRLIAGPNNVFICDVCIDVCVRILAEDDPQDWRNNLIKILASIDQKKSASPKKEANRSKA